jgi:hypothetical protein
MPTSVVVVVATVVVVVATVVVVAGAVAVVVIVVDVVDASGAVQPTAMSPTTTSRAFSVVDISTRTVPSESSKP